MDAKLVQAPPENSKLMEHKKMQNLTAVEKSMNALDMLLEDVPNPTQEELRKLLALQGVFLSNLGRELMESVASKTKVDRKVKLAMQVFARAESALTAAANINGRRSRYTEKEE